MGIQNKRLCINYSDGIRIIQNISLNIKTFKIAIISIAIASITYLNHLNEVMKCQKLIVFIRSPNSFLYKIQKEKQTDRRSRSWVQTSTLETIFHTPFIWIKAWKLKLSGN